MNKNAFSIIELIFTIVVIGIIASVAVPKLMSTKTSAQVASLKQDITTITTSIQSYYLVNGNIDKISDAINVNSSVWDILDTEVKFVENTKTCISIKIDGTNLNMTIDSSVGDICESLSNSGIVTTTYKLQ